MQHILSLSYGKDSIACLEACKLLGYSIDRVIHAEVWATDTIPADLPPMVEFKKKADEIIKARYGLTVEHIAASSRERERERDCHTRNNSTPCALTRKSTGSAFTDSRCCEEHGVIQGSKCNLSMLSEKQTYEKMFYHVPTRKGNLKQGTIKGFPGVVRAKWCQKLKVNCFRKAPLHKELTQILCSISELRQTNPRESNGILAPVLFFHWWKSAGMKHIADNGVRKTIYSLQYTPQRREVGVGSVITNR